VYGSAKAATAATAIGGAGTRKARLGAMNAPVDGSA